MVLQYGFIRRMAKWNDQIHRPKLLGCIGNSATLWDLIHFGRQYQQNMHTRHTNHISKSLRGHG
ncbi:unnamed protein product [Absidia cylindrospora]